jgi:hypothetical protein
VFYFPHFFQQSDVIENVPRIELCGRHRFATRPQQPQRFRGELAEADVTLATGKLIRSDELEHPRPLPIRVMREQSTEYKLVPAIVLHPEDNAFVIACVTMKTLLAGDLPVRAGMRDPHGHPGKCPRGSEPSTRSDLVRSSRDRDSRESHASGNRRHGVNFSETNPLRGLEFARELQKRKTREE